MSDTTLDASGEATALPLADAMPVPLSLTHQHILATVVSEIAARGMTGPLRLLDAGCGDGRLLEYFSRAFAAGWPTRPMDLHGFDVGDHGVQRYGFFDAAIERLETATGRPWRDRLSLVSAADPWPYADASLDAIVSNQVLEHVADHRAFFAQTARVLRPGGFAVHLFPLHHVVVEPHLGVPFAHWFGSADVIAAVIRLGNRLGLGRHDPAAGSLDAYAAAHADFLIRYTNYRTAAQMLADAKRCGLHASFSYSPRYYTAKLRALARRPARWQQPRPGLAHAAATLALRSVSSATLLLSRDETYGLPALRPGEIG